MKINILLLSPLCLLLFGCNVGTKHRHLSSDFKEKHKALLMKAFDIEDQDAIRSIYLINNSICIENEHVSPIFNFYDEKGMKNGSFGNIGHGKGEFIMPHLCEGEKDTMIVIDNGSKMLTSVYNMNTCHSEKSDIGHNVNKLKTIRWPYVGYYHYMHNKISWDIYNVEKKELIESIPFEGEEPHLETFVWSSYNEHLVFAYKYYNKFRICKLSPQMTLKDEIIYEANLQEPREDKCYYSDIVCCKDFFVVLSQRDVVSKANNANSKIQIYNYLGTPIKELSLDNIYLNMVWNERKNQLYLLPWDRNELKSIQL